MKIPGAMKNDLTPFTADVANASMFCGNEKGLGTEKTGAAAKTVCSKIIFVAFITSLFNYRTIIFHSNDINVMF